MSHHTLKIVDLFCGVGGLSHGFFHNNYFEIIAANEILPNMAKAYQLNHPTVPLYVGDIHDFDAKKICSNNLSTNHCRVDLIVGGPPCQAYSTVGKRDKKDPRGQLFQQYYRVVKELKPHLFIFENVKGLLSIQKGQLLKEILTLFTQLGYQLKYKLVNAADYGVPQLRERVIIIGSSLTTPFHYPLPTHASPEALMSDNALKPYITVEQAISDLPLIHAGEQSNHYASEPQNSFQAQMRHASVSHVMDHCAPNNNPKLVKMMGLLPDGGTPIDLPKLLRPSSGYKNTYSRLWWRRPAPTITRNFSTPSSSRCIHPRVARPLTTREGARLQTFPDNYQFYGSRSDRNLQIGNAVPLLLSQALTQSVVDNFKREGLL